MHKQTTHLSQQENEVDNSTNVSSALSQSIQDELLRLLLQCQGGDQKAFHQLYQLTAKRLNGIALRITRNIDSANEVLQEAFIQVWKKRQHYQPSSGAVFTWLSSIVRYRAYDRLRYDKCRQQSQTVEYNEFDGENFDAIPADLSRYETDALDYCLAQLEVKQRQSISMAYLYGYSREDISAHYKTPINTIKSWIRRGLGRLLVCLKD
jgi:RNA polymerase sigma-70 factor (ECF subfamily)